MIDPSPMNSQDRAGALLLIAAKSLQSYVLGSDKLREMVGATQLIEDFCSEEFAGVVLKSLGVNDFEVITAAAGQAAVKIPRKKDAKRAAALIPWAAHQFAPGLEVHAAVADLAESEGGYSRAIESVQAELAESRNAFHYPDLPIAPPPALKAPRSGRVAVEYDRYGSEIEEVDAVALAKRQRRASTRRESRTGQVAISLFDAFAFDPDSVGTDLHHLAALPVHLRHHVDADGNHRTFHARQPAMAIVHADGNGLGQAFIQLAQELAGIRTADAVACFKRFSSDFRRVGLSATKTAIDRLHQEFLPPLPILPIVLAGDDLTVIMRGEIAMLFVEEWLKAFELESREALARLKMDFPATHAIGLDQLSAGAGIAFFQKSHPFASAYEQCSHLAELAKKKAKILTGSDRPPSSVAFHRIQVTGDHDVFQDDSDLASTSHLRLSGMPYFFWAEGGDRHLEHLRELRDAFRALPTGSSRELLSKLRHAPDSAAAWLHRSLGVLASKPGGVDQRVRIERALHALHGTDETGMPRLWHPSGESYRAWTAIPDAISWGSIEPPLTLTPKLSQRQ
jgi:hypothetical protein